MALKMSDLGHLASSEDVHRQWVERLQEVSYVYGTMAQVPVSSAPDISKAVAIVLHATISR